MPEVHDLYRDILTPELEKAGIRLVGWADLDDEQRAWLTEVFTERIFPVLTPCRSTRRIRSPTSRASR